MININALSTSRAAVHVELSWWQSLVVKGLLLWIARADAQLRYADVLGAATWPSHDNHGHVNVKAKC